MSRIQDILNKAERDGAVRRTRGLGGDASAVADVAEVPAPPIPRSSDHDGPHRQPAGSDSAPVSVEQDAPRDGKLDHRLVAALAPQSLVAEQYRSLRTRISSAENGRALRAIIVTSPGKGDGKSLTAANLALTMAQEYQHRVLLIDADLRRPTLHQLFSLREAPGLTDVLMGAATLDDAFVPLSEHHLTVLPSGVPAMHPAELLGSAAMRRVMDAARTRFDRVILDMPPVSPLADVHVLANTADGVLLIVRAGSTPKPAIERALASLAPNKVLGLVLNEVGTDAAAEGYGSYAYIAG
jgi:capsular exopolysaccharide synthesis family protein